MTDEHLQRFRFAVVIATAVIIVIFTTALIISFYPAGPVNLIKSSTPLVIVWELAETNPDLKEIGPLHPVHVVSPTWFKIVDHNGTISRQVDPDYIEWARDRGYQIWPLASNSFDPDITAAVLVNPQIRNNVVNELIEVALFYDFDGLNIDFENFHSDYRDYFTTFITELSYRCREENLVLSVDVTMISSSEYWSLGYDRAALAKEADYIILMAYDEHWQSSPVAGSVASLPWVENGLKQVLREVPAEKLILGLPFYTRLFEIDKSGINPVVLNSWSYSMKRAGEIVTDNNAEITWDVNAKQHVAVYTKNNLTYKMWLEDERSIQKRLDLVRQYSLAGLAGWRRGLELEETWDLISDFIDKY